MEYWIAFGVVALVITVCAMRMLLLTRAELFQNREDKALWFLFLLTFNAIASVLFLVERRRLLAEQKSERRQRRREREPDPVADLFAKDGLPPS